MPGLLARRHLPLAAGPGQPAEVDLVLAGSGVLGKGVVETGKELGLQDVEEIGLLETCRALDPSEESWP